MAVNLGNVVIRFMADTTGFRAGIGLMMRDSNSLGSIMSTVAVAAGAMAVTVGVQAVKAAGDFQKGVTQLATTAGESSKNLKLVGDGIKQIAMDTGESTDQLIKGMYMVESAGNRGKDALNVLSVATKGAVAEGADMEVVAKALTTVMTDFHMPASQAASAMNALMAGVASGKVRLQDLSSSLGAVLPSAQALGISLPQVVGAISAMTNAGTSAQRASQNLASAFRALSAPTSVANKAMAEVGLTSQQVKNELSAGGLTGALQLIEEHVGKTFPKASVQYATAMKAIMGGAQGLKIEQALGGQQLSIYEADVNKVAAAMKQGGTAVLGWSEVQGNFNLQLSRAQEALEVLSINLGTLLLPLLGRLLAVITPMLIGFTNLQSDAAGLSRFVAPLAPAFGNLGSALANLGSLILPVVMNFARWLVTSGTLMGILTGLVAGVILIINALAGLINGLTAVIRFLTGTSLASQIVRDVLIGLALAIALLVGPAAIAALISLVGTLVVALGGLIATAAAAVISFGILSITVLALPLAIGLAIAGIILAIQHWGDITKWLQQVWAGIPGFFGGIINWIRDAFVSLGHDLVGGSVIPDMVNGMLAWFGRLRDNATTIFGNVTSFIMNAWNSLNAGTSRMWGNIFSTIGSFLSQIWNRVQSIGASIRTSFLGVWSSIGGAIGGVIRGMANNAISVLNSLLSRLQDFVNGLASGINAIARAVGASSSVSAPGIGRVSYLARGSANFAGGPAIVGEEGPELVMLPRGTSVMDASRTKMLMGGKVPMFASGTGNAFSDLLGWIGGGLTAIGNFASGPINVTRDLASQVLGHVFSGILSMPPPLSGIATAIGGMVRGWALDMVQKLLGMIKSVVPMPMGGSGGASFGAPGNFSGSVMSWIMQAIGLTGVPASWAGALYTIAMHESGGDPNNINTYDINAINGTPSIGLMQTIGPTFAAHALPGHGNIYNPVDNAAAAIGYIIGRYGSVFNVPGIVSMSHGGPYVGYANGGVISEQIYGVGLASGTRYRFGERGPERVTPLGAGGSSPQVINLVVDGRTLARALGSHLQQEIRLVVGKGGV